MESPTGNFAFKTAFTYFVIASAWILFSDRIVEMVFRSPEALSQAQTVKGWFFVSVTALALFAVLQKEMLRRQKVKASLMEREALYRGIVETTWDGVCIVDERNQSVFSNAQFAGMLGTSVADVQNRNILDFVDAMSREACEQTFKEARAGNHGAQEILFRSREGKPLWTQMKTSRFPRADGNECGVLAMVSNTTEQRQYEEQLRQNYKMNAIGQLAGGIAHDFNNQLMTIMGCAEQLLAETLEPKGKKYVTMIYGAAQRSSDLTQQLLTFARKKRVNSADIDVHKLIDETVSMLRRCIDRSVTIDVQLNAPSGVVQGDASQIQNGLLNLGLNARDAMENGGVLTFKSEGCHFATDTVLGDGQKISAGKYLAIRVSDTGSGMSAEIKSHLFEPFFTTKPAGIGTGMGLASVYGMVKSHKGTIQVESELDKGSEFTIYLPI
jgi:two-component system, cell cycle sensor histidine kinase and response regulator CckA